MVNENDYLFIGLIHYLQDWLFLYTWFGHPLLAQAIVCSSVLVRLERLRAQSGVLSVKQALNCYLIASLAISLFNAL